MKQKINKISILKHDNNIRVYYEDTDAGGLVYHANYLKFAERSRTEMLRKIKIEQLKLKNEHNIHFVVKTLYIEFFKSAILDDLLKIKSVILKITAAKIIMEQTIYNKMTLIAKIDVILGSVNIKGKPSRLPKIVLNKLNTNVNPKE
ncbi:MAG TPA: YbgC/FadM family acyl-CoA thioesterase [Alphaproteobacteria bacterium]|jgi:acyl-CoA thioester hydrolase|nr:YbgC/FadM family acyl-CoA thioesterase [Alphaproteobacteria bacterium]HIK87924.1 YbgC/FadM family acyl-CoA thioesterase [Alphaproteobacteria bacterium]|tara:strand:+ start:2265 stop:2705 length:441 start_codon:yes stop_codon:yes gene_type:complete